jgi:hypothetical protein
MLTLLGGKNGLYITTWSLSSLTSKLCLLAISSTTYISAFVYCAFDMDVVAVDDSKASKVTALGEDMSLKLL